MRRKEKYDEILRLVSERFPELDPKVTATVVRQYMMEISRLMDQQLEFRDKFLGSFRLTEKGFSLWMDDTFKEVQKSTEEARIYHLLQKMKRWQRMRNILLNNKARIPFAEGPKEGRRWYSYRRGVTRNIRINAIQKGIQRKTNNQYRINRGTNLE